MHILQLDVKLQCGRPQGASIGVPICLPSIENQFEHEAAIDHNANEMSAERPQQEGEQEAQRLLSESLSVELSTEYSASLAAVGDAAGGAAACRRALYGSHFLSTWGQRGWEFAVGLIMLELHPTSLLLVSTFGLLDSAIQVVFGASVGSWVDRTERLVAAQRMYMLQNSMVALSALASLLLLWTGARAGALYWACLLAALGAGAASSLGALGATLSVEREWTRALCGADSAALARVNSAMKRIDLTCLIASPISARFERRRLAPPVLAAPPAPVRARRRRRRRRPSRPPAVQRSPPPSQVGLVMTYAPAGAGMDAATLMLLAWNMLAWAPECALLAYAQARSPALAAPRTPPPPPAEGAGPAGGGGGKRAGGDDGAAGPWRRQLDSWATYFQQPVAPAALALALLYLTVMSFGSLMTAYLKWLGMPEAELSVYRGLGAVSGIAATVVFPHAQRWVGLLVAGAASAWLQWVCVVAATAPSLAAALGAGVGGAAARYALVGGLVLSRFGLWSFDLCANQLIQELVPPGQLGAVAGCQGALQSGFQMLAYVAGVVVWQPQRFPLLMAGSCAAVTLAAATFSGVAAARRRGAEGLDVRLAAGDGLDDGP
eukprot:scaffold13.g187.t1